MSISDKGISPKGRIAGCTPRDCREVLEHKSAGEVFRISEEGVQLLLECPLIGTAIISSDKVWLRANNKFFEMLGYAREELGELTWTEVTYAEDLPTDVAQFDRLLKGEIDSYRLEKRFVRKDGGIVYTDLSVGCVRLEDRSVDYVLVLLEDISGRKNLEDEVRRNLRFFESMDRINGAIQGSSDMQTVPNQVLDTVLSLFDCDRTFLLYLGDHEAPPWQISFEKTRPEYDGVFALGDSVPANEKVSAIFRNLPGTDGPLAFGSGNQYPLPEEIPERFGAQASMVMALYPKGDKPWVFGMHQCAKSRVWTASEKQLFQEIGRRLTDGLSSLSAYRDLQVSERKFRASLDSLPGCIARYDLKERRPYAPPQPERLWGRNLEAWPGKTPKKPHPGEELDEYQAKLEQVITTGHPDELACIVSDGEIGGAFTVERDVGKKRLPELELIHGDPDFQKLADNLPNVIIRYDQNCRRVYANRAYEILTGVRPADVIGKAPLELWRLERPRADEYTETLRRVMATRQSERIEAQWFDDGGGRHYCSMQLVPECEEQGQVSGVLTVGTDITEIKTAEQRRVQAREDERKVLSRELHDDLGQRLTALRMDVELMSMKFGKHNPALMAKLGEMDTAVAETVKIVRSLLNMLRPAVVDLGLVPALEWLASEFSNRNDVECELRIPERNIVLAESQSMAIFRIVQECLINAAVHAEAVKVKVSLVKEAGGYLLEIQGDGTGFVLGDSRKRGMFGLKSMERHLEMLGGRLSVETVPGDGVQLKVHILAPAQ